MRWWRLAAAVALGVLALASVSFTRGHTLDLVDPGGRPQAAYAVYRHQGSRLNPAHPVSYDARRPTVIRGGVDGRLRFPGAPHLHWPFPLETAPRLWIEMVYVPALHNAGGRMGGGYRASAAGVWEMDDGRRAVVFDLGDRPDRWQETLSTLSFFLGPLVARQERPRDPEEAAILGELIGHFRAEYEGFLGRWGAAPRPRPPQPASFLSADDRQRWVETVEADLARRPTWGLEIRRLYEREVARLTEVQAALASRPAAPPD